MNHASKFAGYIEESVCLIITVKNTIIIAEVIINITTRESIQLFQTQILEVYN